MWGPWSRGGQEVTLRTPTETHKQAPLGKDEVSTSTAPSQEIPAASDWLWERQTPPHGVDPGKGGVLCLRRLTPSSLDSSDTWRRWRRASSVFGLSEWDKPPSHRSYSGLVVQEKCYLYFQQHNSSCISIKNTENLVTCFILDQNPTSQLID